MLEHHTEPLIKPRMADLVRGSLSRPENVFRAALFLSVLFHLAVILYLKLPVLTEPMRSKVALSVILAKSQDVGQPTPEPPPPVVVPITLPVPEVSALPTPKPPVKPEQISPPIEVAEPLPEPKSEPAPGETLQEMPADPVESSPEIVEAGKVQALLQVDGNGAVRQIIWKTLPAITYIALQQIEQHLRTKTYIATGKSYTLYEIVEIPRE